MHLRRFHPWPAVTHPPDTPPPPPPPPAISTRSASVDPPTRMSEAPPPPSAAGLHGQTSEPAAIESGCSRCIARRRPTDTSDVELEHLVRRHPEGGGRLPPSPPGAGVSVIPPPLPPDAPKAVTLTVSTPAGTVQVCVAPVHENVAEAAAAAGGAVAANVMPRPPTTSTGAPMSNAHLRARALIPLGSVAVNAVPSEGSRVLKFTVLAFHLRRASPKYRGRAYLIRWQSPDQGRDIRDASAQQVPRVPRSNCDTFGPADQLRCPTEAGSSPPTAPGTPVATPGKSNRRHRIRQQIDATAKSTTEGTTSDDTGAQLTPR